MQRFYRSGLIVILACAGGFASIAIASAQDAAQPAQEPAPEIISGEVISLCNYLAKGHRGEEHAEEGKFLVEKRGLPVAILTDGGEIFVAILKGFQPANEKLGPLLGKKVNAKGLVHRHAGANLIEVQIVSEAMD